MDKINDTLIEQWKKDSLTLSLVVAVLKRDIKGLEEDCHPIKEGWEEEALRQEKRILGLLTDDEELSYYAHLVLVEDID